MQLFMQKESEIFQVDEMGTEQQYWMDGQMNHEKLTLH